jgi:hypothetical protein
MGNSKSGKTQSSSTGDPKPAKKTGAFQISSDPVVHGRSGDDVHKYETAPHEPQQPAYEELGQLPESYGENTVFLIARDPKWLFTYWDVSPNSFPDDAGGGKVFLKVLFENGAEESLIEINLAARNWYIPVPDAATTYRVEIGCFDKGGAWVPVAWSGMATTPADELSEESAVDFATVPFHLSFQNLVDTVKAAMGEGESLVSAISRLQGEGRRLAFAAGKAPAWTEEQRQVLIALLGTELVDRVGSWLCGNRQAAAQGIAGKTGRRKEPVGAGCEQFVQRIFRAGSDEPFQRRWRELERAAVQQAARIFHARQCRGDFLRRHASRCEGHDRRQKNQAEPRRHVPLPFQIPGRKLRDSRDRHFAGQGRDSLGHAEVRTRDGTQGRCRAHRAAEAFEKTGRQKEVAARRIRYSKKRKLDVRLPLLF